MKQRVYKFFVNYEKEEAWLNKMSAQGLQCVDYTFGRYTFERGTPGEYVYRLQLLEYVPSHAQNRAYLDFLEDSGVEHFANHVRWVYLRKKAALGPFELFSDIPTRMAHYRRIVLMFIPIAMANFTLGLRAFHDGNPLSKPLNFLNLGAFLLLAYPSAIYLRKISFLKKESGIRE